MLRKPCVVITAAAPLFTDPVHDGPADPMLIINHEDGSLWMFYTARRADFDGKGVEWYFGTNIGVAVSVDGGASFKYHGELSLNFEPGLNTFWAPEIIYVDRTYHMYVTYSSGVSDKWRTDYCTAYFTSTDLWNWNFVKILDMECGVIDVAIAQIPSGSWRMWYKRCNEGKCGSYYADSTDLANWEEKGLSIPDRENEGPNVFYWKGSYWLIVDSWNGIGVYKSQDAFSWKYQKHILNEPGTREGDLHNGHHADVLVCDDRAYIIYFTYNYDRYTAGEKKLQPSYDMRRSFIEIAELELKENEIFCDRNKPCELKIQK